MYASIVSIGQVISYPVKLYQDINPATLSGAIDIVVVENKDGELCSSPFHVRFGKLKLLRPLEKVIHVSVNGVATELPMKVGDQGEAFFVVATDELVPSEYQTSPIPTPSELADEPEPLNLNDSDDVATAAKITSPDELHESFLSAYGSASDLPGLASRLNISTSQSASHFDEAQLHTANTNFEEYINERKIVSPDTTQDELPGRIMIEPQQRIILQDVKLESNKGLQLPFSVVQNVEIPSPNAGQLPFKFTQRMNITQKQLDQTTPSATLCSLSPTDNDDFSDSEGGGVSEAGGVYKAGGGPLSDDGIEYRQGGKEKHRSSFSPIRLSSGPLSDTEIEYDESHKKQPDGWTWSWGGLPAKTTESKPIINTKSQADSEPMQYDEKVTKFLAGLEKTELEAGSAISGEGSGDVTSRSTNPLRLPDDERSSIEISLCGLKEVRSAATRVSRKSLIVRNKPKKYLKRILSPTKSCVKIPCHSSILILW